ncbi:GerW family sporulation protein [Guptibacillus hwajinpoensis]|uniref:Spore protein n=1 Tax=Guptibacillus hwajinpoensis TaxID=208199 RepID=A0A0J6CW45_9BACL|nr:GerW family sporulation protein [Alkalihalobacillus macyae]KMM37385.1 spore protein [Alkalihalobacillus macyae]
MAEHPIEGLMQTAMENLKDMIDVNTIIGDPVETPDGSVILTVSKVGFGFAAGGSEFMLKQQSGSSRDQNQSKGEPFGGGSGGGVSITPIAFLIVSAGDIKMIHLDNTTHLYERLLDLAPQAIEKVQSMLQNMNKDSKEKKDQSNGQQGSGQKHTTQSKNLFRSHQRGQHDDEKQDLNF